MVELTLGQGQLFIQIMAETTGSIVMTKAESWRYFRLPDNRLP